MAVAIPVYQARRRITRKTDVQKIRIAGMTPDGIGRLESAGWIRIVAADVQFVNNARRIARAQAESFSRAVPAGA
jgi:hypothetical protein